MSIPYVKPRMNVKNHLPPSVKLKINFSKLAEIENTDDVDEENNQTVMIIDSNIEDQLLKALASAQEY